MKCQACDQPATCHVTDMVDGQAVEYHVCETHVHQVDKLQPAKLPGASLRPLLTKPDAEWNRPAFTQVERGGAPGRSVRTPRWRYTEWGEEGKDGTELYDHQSDPGEMKNLAGDPKQAATIAELKTLVRKNWPERVTGGKAEGGKKGKKAKAE